MRDSMRASNEVTHRVELLSAFVLCCAVPCFIAGVRAAHA